MSPRGRGRGPLLARLLAPAGPPRECRVTRAGADVVVVPGRYCVTYLLLGAETIGVVDVGSQADIDAILDALARAGRSAADVRWVMPTHLHFDHVMGIDALARRLGVPVALGAVAHAGVTGRRRLRYPHWFWLWRAIPTWPMQGMPFPPLADWRYAFAYGFPGGRGPFGPALLGPLAHGTELPGLPGWKLFDGPGHADDGILLHHAASGLLIAGDTVRNFYGGEWNPLLCDGADYARTQATIRALHVETVLPAHGPVVEGPAVVDRLKSYPPYVP